MRYIIYDMDNKKVLSNFIWRFAERTGAQLVSFIVSIVLARILDPEVFGTVALMVVFTTILNVFVDSGLGNALIQKKDADQLDFSTVFYTNISFCTVLYIGMFFASPYIAGFYDDPSMTPMLRVLCLTVLISGVKNVNMAYVSKHMIFKKFFFSTLGGPIGAAVLGIAMALNGFGAWAIIAQQVFNTAVDTSILWITVKWRPSREFSFERLKGLFSFGWKLLVSALIDTVYTNLRQLIIGKFYQKNELAFYNQGEKFPNVIVTNINNSIDSVLLPVMSKEQDDVLAVKRMARRSIKTSTYVMTPLMIGLFVTAPNIVQLVLTEKWMGCVFFLRAFCISYMLYPIHTANLNAIKAIGRSDIFLKLEIIKKIVGLIILFISMFFGVKAMVLSQLGVSFFSMAVNAWPNRKLLKYSYKEQLMDLVANMLCAVGMGIAVALLDLLPLYYVIRLILQILIGALLYIGLSYFSKNETFFYLLDIIRKRGKKEEG